jgi:hypothetical protein
VLSTTFDPDGRRVVLTEERWAHIKRRHPELTGQLGEVMRAIREPDRRTDGREPFEEWFFLEGVRPAGWLQVVVHFDDSEGQVITAFPRGLE